MSSDHVDVLIVGAGLSGIGAAHHLQHRCPGKSYAILEARDAIGGTWDLFRYPGIRSDSDMFTLGYSFRPWTAAKSIADGPSILEYVRDAARDGDIERHIRFHHRVIEASWSSADARWTVTAERTDTGADTDDSGTGETVTLTANFLFGCTGYYRYDAGYMPDFPNVDDYAGTLVHPQHWPDDLDHTNKKIVVIGSGATAVTLVPALAQDGAAHVTMLQRSPTYIMTLPGEDPIAKVIRRALPEKAAYAVVRWKNVAMQGVFFQLSRRAPRLIRRVVAATVKRQLPDDVPLDPHFTPTYDPWDQRVCLVPDGDLFTALRERKASIVTDRIATFTRDGLRLESGHELQADIVISATGLRLQALGGIGFSVDGRAIDLASTVGYKGMMFSGIPNLAIALGYTNASWTLKCDLTCEYVCRLLNHMDFHGYRRVLPRELPPGEGTRPLIDLQSGYVTRAVASFPKQGNRAPWRLYQNYARDIMMLRRGPLEDEGIEFSRDASAPGSSAAAEPVAA
ncbi:MAG TPA: NAD(P)/FAD-dependent oxidoreductase [Baekduia sp.]|uniref:flavin-containing monooxygenase n=1 Tax=Baekduia sp. TaxID=2600305 RepID=UPI002D792052|nr:NAD(P)/FAD-dependent oxidoreductase [Baekduia sp.]HET6510394.1 NAD(P)/FAD-dependent oxidoreductase [Baekduia sp.]